MMEKSTRNRYTALWIITVGSLMVVKESTDDFFSWRDLAWGAGGVAAGYGTARLITF